MGTDLGQVQYCLAPCLLARNVVEGEIIETDATLLLARKTQVCIAGRVPVAAIRASLLLVFCCR
jgi:hypothetical protein